MAGEEMWDAEVAEVTDEEPLRSQKKKIRATLGIPQGCPTSGILFVVALDAWLTVLIEVLGEEAVTAAFADDVATAFCNACSSLPKTLALFDIAGRAHGLHLHGGKVVVLCLRADLHEEWRHWLSVACPELADAHVTDTEKTPWLLQWMPG
eukprot:1025310-Amphidinium_carterae.1